MKIKFSRHAKRRGKLYGISEEAVVEILNVLELTQGYHEIIKNINGFVYPIKVIVDVQNDMVTVITNYPLKKGGTG